MKSKILSLIAMWLAILAFCFLMTVTVPKYAGAFENQGLQLPLLTRLVISLSQFISRFFWILALAMVPIAAVLHLTAELGLKVKSTYVYLAVAIIMVVILVVARVSLLLP